MNKTPKSKAEIVLTDTFNSKVISRHRTIDAAVNARGKHLEAVKKASGRNSYLTYSITHSDGQTIAADELYAAEYNFDKRRLS